MPVLRLDHTAIAVRDLRPAVRLWGEMLGGTYAQGRGEYRGFVQFTYPDRGRVELIFPTGPEETFLTCFLDRRGEGMHHMTFIVDDLEAEIARFKGGGYAVVDEDRSDPRWEEAFLSPRSTHARRAHPARRLDAGPGRPGRLLARRPGAGAGTRGRLMTESLPWRDHVSWARWRQGWAVAPT